MLRALLVFGILAAVYVYIRFVRSGTPLALAAYRDVSPEHYERIVAAMDRFEAERQGRGDIHALSAHRATVSKHVHELLFRLPNDSQRYAELAALSAQMEASLQDVIQVERKAKGKHLEFPYPLDSYFMHLEPVILSQDRGQSPTYLTSSSQVWVA
jgi:hypothetical protein